MLNPFPVRADGTRFDEPLGNSLGANSLLGTTFSAGNLNHEPGRVQRFRVSVQRELTRNISVQAAFNGMFSDRLETSIRQDYLAEQYYNGSNARDLTQQNFLNGNVTNPFFIGNFESLRRTTGLYNRWRQFFLASSTIPAEPAVATFNEYALPHAAWRAAREPSRRSPNAWLQQLPIGKTRKSSVESHSATLRQRSERQITYVVRGMRT